MFHIYKKEINSFLDSFIAYVVMIIFLVSLGLFVWVFRQTNILDYGYADLDTFFNICPYVFMFLIPAICMRTFAEEYKTGTIELLLTQPTKMRSIVLGKYLANLTLSLLCLLPTIVYCGVIYYLGTPQGNLDQPAIAASYIGLILLASAFTSIGCFSSILSTNQVISFVLALFISYIFYDGITYMSQINIWSNWGFIIGQWGIDYHYNFINKGVLASNHIFYFIAFNFLFLYFTYKKLGQLT